MMSCTLTVVGSYTAVVLTIHTSAYVVVSSMDQRLMVLLLSRALSVLIWQDWLLLPYRDIKVTAPLLHKEVLISTQIWLMKPYYRLTLFLHLSVWLYMLLILGEVTVIIQTVLVWLQARVPFIGLIGPRVSTRARYLIAVLLVRWLYHALASRH